LNTTGSDYAPFEIASSTPFVYAANIVQRPLIYNASNLSTVGLKTTFWVNDGKL